MIIRRNNCLLVLLCLLFQLADVKRSFAQADAPSYMIRVFDDDDFWNDLGLGTDKAYSSGEQLTLFYKSGHKPGFFLDKILPKAGDSSINIYSLGIMQLMYTPSILTPSYYIPNDYSYSGALVGKHSLYSYNAEKKYDLQTELVFGVMGPASLAGSTQRWFHRVIHDTAVPNGWGNQYLNSPLLNVNFNAEKEIYSNKCFEAVGNCSLSAGTMFDGAEAGVTIYLGKMHPYFNGMFGLYSTPFSGNGKGRKKAQFYFMMKTAGQYVMYSALLQGGLFAPQPMVKIINGYGAAAQAVYMVKPAQQIENFVAYESYGPVIAYSRFCISFTQTYSLPVLKNVYAYIYGNVTIYYSW